MKTGTQSVLKLLSAAFLLCTSLYCLLAFIPYTYFFLVKEPPYPWLSWFARCHSVLYWPTLATAVASYWPQRRNPLITSAWILQAIIGLFITWRNFVPAVQNNWTAYAMAIVMLVPVLLAGTANWFSRSADGPLPQRGAMFSYGNAAAAGVLIAFISIAGALVPGRLDPHLFLAPASGVELAVCVIAAHVWLALLLVSIINAVVFASARNTRYPLAHRTVLVNVLLFCGLAIGCIAFLHNALTFTGWPSYLYSLLFSAAVVVSGFAILRPLFASNNATGVKRKLVIYALAGSAALLTLTAPVMIGELDWNGILRTSVTLLLWIFLPMAVFLLRPRTPRYSFAGVAGVLVVSGFIYWGLTASAFVWAKQLGGTDGAITRAVEAYSTQNVSFSIAHELLAGGAHEKCGELCQTLRQYTNIRHAEAKFNVDLVDQLARTTEKRPDIFIIVVDSLRPDFLGAYNARVDFTPNLDAFARDSFVIKNAYTQYAGTTLSEPALWTGTLLLHSHYLRPFDRVNNLEKLLKADQYRMVVSYDSVLRQTLSDSSDLVKLDTAKAWNEYEISSTLQQLESFLDNPARDKAQPVFFYSQPMNVHMFARNKLPRMTDSDWTMRQGVNNTIAYKVHGVDQYLGQFFNYLKARKLYDDSIIIITADHGEATEGLGRQGHSTIIFPEVMRVPLLIHLPNSMKSKLVYKQDSLATLTDITPTLYYLLGHRPVKSSQLLGHPLFVYDRQEFNRYPAHELLLASDVRPTYGLLSEDGRFMYTLTDSPLQSALWDLQQDPGATHSILTEAENKQYEDRVLSYLREIAHFYEYRPTGNTEVAAR
jgi:sulfatase-like protein